MLVLIAITDHYRIEWHRDYEKSHCISLGFSFNAHTYQYPEIWIVQRNVAPRHHNQQSHLEVDLKESFPSFHLIVKITVLYTQSGRVRHWQTV